jgi:hypothetical protein
MSSTKDNYSAKKLVGRWQLVLLIGLTLVRGLIYLSIFPPWVAPDEPAHFEAVRIIGQEGYIPSSAYYEATPVNAELSQSFQTFRMWELLERATPTWLLKEEGLTDISFTHYPYPGRLIYADTYPILPHLLLSPISDLTASFDIATELYILRLVSIVLAIAVTIMAWLITRRVFPDQPQFWLAIPAFVVFLPMHTHIFASLNTDIFAILLASVLLFLLLSLFDRGLSRLKLLFAICLLLLALFIKRTLIFTFLWVGIAAIWYLGQRYQWPLKRIAQAGLITLALIGAGLSCVIINSQRLANSFITLFNMDIGRDLSFAFLKHLSLSEITTIYIKSGLFAFITFWGDFGGANINIPWPWAWGLMAFCGLIGAGAFTHIFNAFRHPERCSPYQRHAFMIFITGIILSLTNAFFPVIVVGPTWGPPARYFFPVIIPIATFFFLGVRQLCPARYRPTYLLPLWLTGLVAYDALVMTRVLIPFLYG